MSSLPSTQAPFCSGPRSDHRPAVSHDRSRDPRGVTAPIGGGPIGAGRSRSYPPGADAAARAPTRSTSRRPNSAASTATATSAFGARPRDAPPVRDRLAVARAAGRVDLDGRGLGRHQARVEGRRDDQRVVDERAVEAVVAGVELEVEPEGVGQEPDHRVARDRPPLRRQRARGPGSSVSSGRLPARRAMATTSSVVRRACSVTSRPSTSARGTVASASTAACHAAKASRAASGSQWTFHSDTGVVLPGHAERAAHAHPAPQEPRERRFREQRDREVGQRPQRHERQLARSAARRLDDHVGTEPRGQRRRRLGQLGVAEAARAVGLGGDLERPQQRRRAPGGHLDLAAARELEHGAGVSLGVDEGGVARQAGHGDELGVRARARVQQRQRVVDPGVDVEEQGDAVRAHLGFSVPAGASRPNIPRHSSRCSMRTGYRSRSQRSRCSR